MDTFARNALRLSLAGAGVAVLGAGLVGQASAAEDNAQAQQSPQVPDTSSLLNTNLTPTNGNTLPSTSNQNVGSLPSAEDLPSAEQVSPSGNVVQSQSLPLSDVQAPAGSIPSLSDAPQLQGADLLQQAALPGLS